MKRKIDRKIKKQRGLTDKMLIAKYDTGNAVNFDKALKLMGKSPSISSLLKQKK